jgi:hypothetical protein
MRKSHDTAPLWRSPANFSVSNGGGAQGSTKGGDGGGYRSGTKGGGGGGMVDTGVNQQNAQGAAFAAAGAVMMSGAFS